VDLALVPVLAVSAAAGGVLAFLVGILTHRLCITYSPYAAWTLGAITWILAMFAVYAILTFPPSTLLQPTVFFPVLPVVYLSARLGYGFSESRTQSIANRAQQHDAAAEDEVKEALQELDTTKSGRGSRGTPC
jgi:hypothetical protein